MQRLISCPARALIFIHSSGTSGIGRNLYSFLLGLDRKRLLPDFICPQEGPLADQLRQLGIKIIPFEPGKLRNPLYLAVLWKRLAKEKYHILHIHSGQWSAFWKTMGRLLGIPVIIYTEHIFGQTHSWIKNKAALFFHNLSHPLFNSMVDKIIAVSNDTRRCFIERQGVSPDKVVTVYNCVDTVAIEERSACSIAARDELGIRPGCHAVGIFGRLAPEKEHRIFVLAASEALKTFPDTKFVIVGEGPERQNIESLVNKLGIGDKVILIGFREEPYGIMACMDITVLPSHGEGSPNVILESMAMFKPVVASDIPAVREIIKDGVNGMLFPVGDYKTLAEKICLLLRDDGLRKRLGEAGHKTVKEGFSVPTMTLKVLDVYFSALAEKGYRVSVKK